MHREADPAMLEPAFRLGQLRVYSGRFGVNTIIYRDMAVDPNIGCLEPYAESSVRRVLVTHGHADHFGDATELKRSSSVKVFAPRLETCMVEDPSINWRGLFGWAALPGEFVTPYFHGEGVRVDGFSESLDLALSLPGHTHAHTGYMLGELGVAIAGDALYPPELWKKYGILYHVDPDLMLESLKMLRRASWDYIIPGHGRVMNRYEGLKAIEANMRAIEGLRSLVLSKLPSDTGITECELLSRVARAVGARGARSLTTIGPAVRGHLVSLYRRRLVEGYEEDGYLLWRRR